MEFKGIANPEGPFVKSYEFLRDLLVLNLLTILGCIGIVTIVPSITACHYTALKLLRHESGYISKEYYKSFKTNLKDGILSELIMIAVGAAMYFDIIWFGALREESVSSVGTIITELLIVIIAFTTTFYFPVFSKFDARIRDNIKNAFRLSFAHPLITLGMLLINACPVVMCYFAPVLSPILLFFGFSLPIYFNAMLYNRIFAKLEGVELS